MTEDKNTIHIMIDSAELREGVKPEIDDSLSCSFHPDAKIAHGFGLAGGGFGPYTYCAECGVILSKQSFDEDES